MIKAIISDKGNVISFFDNSIMFNKLSEHSKYSPEEMKSKLLWSDLDIDYHEGKVSSEEFYKGVSEMFGLRISFDEFKNIYNSVYFGINNELIEVFRKLKGKYKILMLSDANEMRMEYSFKNHSYWDVFDDKILSYEVRCSKSRNPDKILNIAVERAGCLPEECVLIDDVERYAKAAKRFGMYSIHYTGMENLLRDFGKMGIKVN